MKYNKTQLTGLEQQTYDKLKWARRDLNDVHSTLAGVGMGASSIQMHTAKVRHEARKVDRLAKLLVAIWEAQDIDAGG
jgi:hypothetical protein